MFNFYIKSIGDPECVCQFCKGFEKYIFKKMKNHEDYEQGIQILKWDLEDSDFYDCSFQVKSKHSFTATNQIIKNSLLAIAKVYNLEFLLYSTNPKDISNKILTYIDMDAYATLNISKTYLKICDNPAKLWISLIHDTAFIKHFEKLINST